MSATPAPAAKSRKRGEVKRWSASERAALRTAFMSGGGQAAKAVLPGRTLGSIYNQAVELGLPAPRQKRRTSYPPDPRLDEAITALAQGNPTRGDWKKLARRFNRPAHHITNRLRVLGFLNTRVVESEWLPAEVELLHETAHYAATTASTMFRRKGFSRTAWAITIRRRLLRVDCTRYGQYTARQLGELLGQPKGAVERLVRSELLQATRNPGEADNTHYTITDRQLRAFIVAHPLRLDLRRVPPANIPWLIDIIAGAAAKAEA